jgi:hypothetical protein
VTSDQLNTYVSVTTSVSPATYDTAESAIIVLGMRLADQCYEHGLTIGGKLSWHSMGQESGFASERSLVMAPTDTALANWRNQLRALPGETSLIVPCLMSCP